jgi:hypothetical protein
MKCFLFPIFLSYSYYSKPKQKPKFFPCIFFPETNRKKVIDNSTQRKKKSIFHNALGTDKEEKTSSQKQQDKRQQHNTQLSTTIRPIKP